MILAIDIGGTKTLLALCTKGGEIHSSYKFKTPIKYTDFKKELAKNIGYIKEEFSLVVVAAPGKINRKKGLVEAFGNLSWKNVPIAPDLRKLTGKKVLIENDANLAGLYAAHSLNPIPHKVLYLTISTGIGSGIITDGVLDPDFLDSEGGNIMLEHEGKLIPWEKFASGKAIVAKYGKRASEINNPKLWQDISYNFALGMVDLAAVLDPDVILIGGGVGTHFNKYKEALHKNVKKMLPVVVDMPKILPAPNAEEAVIYGCIILAKQNEQ